MSLKQQISLHDIQDIFNKVRKQLEYRQHNGYHDAPTTSLCRFIIPQDTGMEQVININILYFILH